jgi:tripeptide aminopeptidase
MASPTITLAPEKRVQELLGREPVLSAFRFFESHAAEITEEHIRLCSIPAPPFGEAERASYLRERFREHGLSNAHIDEEGNCVALRAGHSRSPLLVLSAHLDTVFPADTDFTVKRDRHRLLAPGISDDGCGLAALVALLRALEASDIETEGSILFVGTVGEEGEGNLRGARHLLTAGAWAKSVDAFISFDGPGVERITHAALGSRRYRVSLRGPGGHSWGDFGVVNPVHALGRAVARLAAYPAPSEPRTTFNVGRIAGGASVNVIPREAMMDVDLRSASATELQRLDAFFRRSVREATDDENAGRRAGDPPLELDLKLIGDRPSGETPTDAPIVRLAEEATRSLGYHPRLDRSSTDSNVAISLSIPAITIGAGGSSGNSHTLNEWYDPRGRDIGLKRALIILLGLVGIR